MLTELYSVLRDEFGWFPSNTQTNSLCQWLVYGWRCDPIWPVRLKGNFGGGALGKIVFLKKGQAREERGVPAV